MKISAGIDAGMDYTKAVVLKEDGSYASGVIKNGLEATQIVTDYALEEALKKLSVSRKQVSYYAKTGLGSEETGLAGRMEPSFFCIAKGTNHLLHGVGTIIDMGNRQTLALKCRDGIVYKNAASEKCASGAGAYLNMVSSFLNMDLSEMNRLYFEAAEDIVLETKCAVFAESEIISLVHRKVPVSSIVRGAFNGLARRINAQILGLPPDDVICIVGGGAMIPAVQDAIGKISGKKTVTVEEPQITGALGAALLVMKQEGGVAI